MNIPADFAKLLPPKKAERHEPWKGPVYLLWVFDPMDGSVTIDHNHDRHRAEAITHSDMRPDVVHPSRLNGYINRIQGGWRITSEDHKPVTDPFVIAQIRKELRKEFPPKPLPAVPSV